MKSYLLIIFATLLLCLPVSAQTIEINSTRKGVRNSGDVAAMLLPAAELTAILWNKDWNGLKQGIFSGVTAVGLTYALKHIVKKERPDHSDKHSFPSMHTAISFTSASFIQRRYGWKWGIPAYVVASYVGWSRVYSKKHDWWDVAAGAAIGVGSTYLFTRPFTKKLDLSFCPLAGENQYGIYASIRF